MNRSIPALALALAALIQQAPAVAQSTAPSPTEQRLQQLEAEKRAADAAEAAKWRTFPKPAVGGPFNPLAPDSWLNRQIGKAAPGTCQYNWAGWKIDPATGWRITERRCVSEVGIDRVAVSCRQLQIAVRFARQWMKPRLPENEGERQMVVALCDNLTSAAPAGKGVR